MWLHALDGLHLSGDIDKWLFIIKSLENSRGKSLLDVLDGSGHGNGGITITSNLRRESGGEGRLKVDEDLVFVHGVVLVDGDDKGEEFHLFRKVITCFYLK